MDDNPYYVHDITDYEKSRQSSWSSITFGNELYDPPIDSLNVKNFPNVQFIYFHDNSLDKITDLIISNLPELKLISFSSFSLNDVHNLTLSSIEFSVIFIVDLPKLAVFSIDSYSLSHVVTFSINSILFFIFINKMFHLFMVNILKKKKSFLG